MQRKDPELTGSKGCVSCRKACQFKGIRTIKSSHNALGEKIR